MKTFIGVKLIHATPMLIGAAMDSGLIRQNHVAEVEEEEGYHVKYPDGYESWAPKSVFEAAYFELDDGTCITEGDVDRMMGELEGVQISPKSTLVRAEKSLIGFDTYNVSSCVDPGNYDTEKGLQYGSGPIKSEFWNCLGFVLQWARNGLK